MKVLHTKWKETFYKWNLKVIGHVGSMPINKLGCGIQFLGLYILALFCDLRPNRLSGHERHAMHNEEYLSMVNFFKFLETLWKACEWKSTSVGLWERVMINPSSSTICEHASQSWTGWKVIRTTYIEAFRSFQMQLWGCHESYVKKEVQAYGLA
jgi:hypothetical protein